MPVARLSNMDCAIRELIPITDLQLRLRGAFLLGDNNSEYGEKQNDYKVELRVRYYFD